MYSVYILYFLVLVLFIFLLFSNLNINLGSKKENFNNNITGNITILNRLIRKINNRFDTIKVDNPTQKVALNQLTQLDSINI